MKAPRRFGWVRDRPDHRDWRYGAPRGALEALAGVVDLSDEFPPIYDQGDLGSCTAQATVALLEHVEAKERQTEMRLSRLELYYHSREPIGATGWDSGAEIRDSIKATASRGVAAERLWPYDTDQFAVQPPSGLYRSDRYHRTIEYRSLEPAEATMRACLTEGYGFEFGFPAYESIFDIGGDGTWFPRQDERVAGYHAVVAVGYDYTLTLPMWRIRNSWGPGWGHRGHFYVTAGFMASNAFDLWTIRTST